MADTPAATDEPDCPRK